MKIPKARKLPSGSWFIQMRLGGESISVTELTEKQCIQTAQLIKAEYLAGKRVKVAPEEEPVVVTVGQVLDNYIEARSNVLSPSTIRGYDIIRRTRWQSIIKDDVTSVDWQSAINTEAKLCKPKTLHNAWMLLNAALYAHDGQRPRVSLPQVPKQERPYLNPDQINAFLRAVQGEIIEIPALLALCSLRCSEILGLTWRNVDTKNGVINVRGSMVRNMSGKYVHKDTNKNAASDRVVPIIMPHLKELLRNAPPHEPDDAVVPYTQQVLYARINTVCRHAGIPEVGVHGLRHSFASLAYHLNVPYKVAMQIGGWSDDATMQRIYTHIGRQEVTNAAASMTSFFSEQKEQPAG